jgi:hypothetical protein
VAGLIAAASVLIVLVIIVAVNGGGKDENDSQSDSMQVISASTISIPSPTAVAASPIPQPDTYVLNLDYGERFQCSVRDFDLPDSIRESDVTWPTIFDDSGVTCSKSGVLEATNIQFDPTSKYNSAVYVNGHTSEGIELQYKVIVGNGQTYNFDWSDSPRNMKTVHGYTYIASPAIPNCLGFTLMFGYDLNSGKITGTNWSVWVRENGDTWVFVGDITATAGNYENYDITFDRPITFSELIVQAPKEYNNFSASISYDVTNLVFYAN